MQNIEEIMYADDLSADPARDDKAGIWHIPSNPRQLSEICDIPDEWDISRDVINHSNLRDFLLKEKWR